MISYIFHRKTCHKAGPILLTVILMGLMTSACGITGDLFGPPPPPPPCPSVSILGNAERITQFRAGPGRDLTDITVEARIDDFIARCIYDVDKDTGIGQVYVELSLGITAARGAANDKGFAEIPYFVTVTNLNKKVLSKNTFAITTVFEGNRYRLTAYDEPVILSTPISPPQTGRDYLIYVGFQLTPDQLEYNRLLRQMGN